MTEDDLLARFNALKPSSIPSLAQSSTPKPDPGDELVNRFLRFRSILPEAKGSEVDDQARSDLQEREDTYPNTEDHKTLKELLADVIPSSEWKADGEDERNIQKLLADAQKHITSDQDDQSHAQDVNNDTTTDVDQDKHKEVAGDYLQQQPSDDVLADEYLQQILDELDIDEPSKDPPDQHAKHAERSPSELNSHPDPTISEAIALPSAPSEEPQSLSPAPFSLPSAPSTAPTARRASTQAKSSLLKYSDGDIETWCIICCDDASVRCLGCDGDLFCGKCWREGHTGPDAGLEEKTHKAVRFVKPKDEEKRQAGLA